MKLEIPIRFVNKKQEAFFNLSQRNQCFSGGYGNGKTHVIVDKAIVLGSTFPNYRCAFFRRVFKDLRRTTMATFFQVCPPELYSEKYGGRRADIDGYCRLINGSEFFFIGVDLYDEKSLKSFEINSAFIDQAEELDENIYIHIDSRVGRWSGAEIPEHIKHLEFPINEFTKKPVPPSYTILACNPDSRLHWIYRRYHPDSQEYKDKYFKTHIMITCASTENPALNKETLTAMMSRDKDWVDRYVYGEWGISDATIHTIIPDSTISPSTEWLDNFISKSSLYRILDHGDASPTCCLWIANFDKIHLIYREYYMPNKLISEHRSNIASLSKNEIYRGNYADPAIFKKNSQKYGGRWSVAEEYLDKQLGDNSIFWQPADNNEFTTRNRINELLRFDPTIVNPITGELGSPRLFFVSRSEIHPNGCFHSINETNGQRRKLLGHDDGKPIYTDDRDDRISDHAYDCVRYYASLRSVHREVTSIKIAPGSFFDIRNDLLMKKYGRSREGELTPAI